MMPMAEPKRKMTVPEIRIARVLAVTSRQKDGSLSQLLGLALFRWLTGSRLVMTAMLAEPEERMKKVLQKSLEMA